MYIYRHKNNKDTAIGNVHIEKKPNFGTYCKVNFWNIHDMQFGGSPDYIGSDEIKLDKEENYERIRLF